MIKRDDWPCETGRRQSRYLFGLFILLVWTMPSRAQTNYLTDTGSPRYTTAVPVEFGFVNAGNGDLHIQIPIAAYPQRGKVPYIASLVYDSHIWQDEFISAGDYLWEPTNIPNSWGGWRFETSASPGTVTYSTFPNYTTNPCNNAMDVTYYEDFLWTAPDGTQHSWGGYLRTQYSPSCPSFDGPSASGFAVDSSGYLMVVTNYTQATVYAPNGIQVYPTVKDTNGNFFSADANGNIIDTLGRTPVTATTNCNGNSNQICYALLNSKGTTSTVTVTLETIAVHTAFGQQYSTEYSGNITVIQSVALPDGSSYQFSYDSGTTAGHWGLLTGVTLPEQGQIGYSYVNFADTAGSHGMWVNTHVSGGATWTFTPALCTPYGCQQTTLLKPNGDNTVYTFTNKNGAWRTQVQYYTGAIASQNLIETFTDAWTYGGYNVQSEIQTTTVALPGGANVSTAKRIDYRSADNTEVNKVSEWKYYTGTRPTTPDRITSLTYRTDTSHNIDQPSSIITTTGSGTVVVETNITYDSYGSGLVTVSNVTQHDDANFSSSYTTRGNPTQIQRCTNAGACTTSFVQTVMAYDTTGQVTQVTDANNNVTKFGFANNFFDDGTNGPTPHSGAPSTNAFLTQITLPPPFSWISTLGYYWGDGQTAKKTDQNGKISTFDYLDPLDRLTQSVLPDGGWTLNRYSSPTLHDTFQSVDDASPSSTCSSCVYDRVTLDGLGRESINTLESDPEGNESVVTAYDPNGRTLSVTNPYRTTSDPTYGLDTYSYDGLDRRLKVTHTDGTIALSYYGAAVTSSVGGLASQLCSTATYGIGFPSLFVDEAGKKRELWTDGFGRTIEVDEPNNSGTLATNTCYAYDSLDNRTAVAQGTQTRTFTYDPLSRLTQSATPESGTTSYTYAGCSGDPSEVCTRTDARNIKTTYTYDQLNRLTGISYSGGVPATPSVTHTYDSGTNQKGFRTGMTDGSGSATWTSDALGRVLTEQRTIAGIQKSISYSYHLDGSLKTVTYPSGRTITYSVSNAERSTSAIDSSNNIQYALTASYAPTGGLNGVIYGKVSSGFNGVSEARTYNSRLQNASIVAASSAGTAENLAFSYGTSANNGTLNSIQNNVTSGLGQSFTYDSMNRVITGATTSNGVPGCWGQNFGSTGNPPDDNLSNLTQINVTQCIADSLSVTVDPTTNRINSAGFQHDLSGNMTTEGGTVGYTYQYDGENDLTQASGMSGGPWNYAYDGNGVRAKKSNSAGGTLYWRSVSGESIAESDLTGSTSNAAYKEYIFFGGRRIASRDGLGNVYYYYADHLGSTTAITNSSGAPCYEATFTPYGEEHATQAVCSTDYKFTGYERDTETGLDYAFNRYYNFRLGRFMSADPLAGDASNPQSLNRYAYALNSPSNLTDPSGAAPPCTKNCYPVHSSPFFVTCNHYNGGSANQRCENTVNCFVDGAPIGCGTLNSMFVDEFALVITSFNSFLVGYRNGPGAVGSCAGGLCVSSTSEQAVYATLNIASYGNTGGEPSWWGTFASTFFHGVLHGDRQTGESRTTCVFRNANETTLGRHGALLGVVAASAAAAAALASKVQLDTPKGPATVTGAANTALWVGRMVYTLSGGYISGLAVIEPVANGIAVVGRYVAPVAAAAEIGLLAGSALNCR
jgi:RHS repeat-associated protein